MSLVTKLQPIFAFNVNFLAYQEFARGKVVTIKRQFNAPFPDPPALLMPFTIGPIDKAAYSPGIVRIVKTIGDFSDYTRPARWEYRLVIEYPYPVRLVSVDVDSVILGSLDTIEVYEQMSARIAYETLQIIDKTEIRKVKYGKKRRLP
jgi:hypothetical protein